MGHAPYHMDKRREVLLSGLNLAELTGVEIGPLDAPIVRKSDGPVIYVDHADRGRLVEHFKHSPVIDLNDIVDVDVIWGEQPLYESVGAGSADYVVASHVAEHVPDLVGWLVELHQVLKPGGQLLLIMPDKRMSYDCLRRETGLIDVLDAYVRQAKRPQTYQLLDCALGMVQSDAYQMHTNDVSPHTFPPIHTIDSALQIARHALQFGEYVDIHCWAFTPRSFCELLRELNRYDLVSYGCAGLIETDPGSNWEFGVKLRSGYSKAEAEESWRSAIDTALHYIQGSAAEARYKRNCVAAI